TYDNANRRSTLTLPNGIVATYAYNRDSRLTGISYTLNGNSVGDLTYGYDTARRRVSAGGSLARTSLPLAVNAATYDAANELSARDGGTLTYDANGNLTNDGLNTYTWNERNQLA